MYVRNQEKAEDGQKNILMVLIAIGGCYSRCSQVTDVEHYSVVYSHFILQTIFLLHLQRKWRSGSQQFIFCQRKEEISTQNAEIGL